MNSNGKPETRGRSDVKSDKSGLQNRNSEKRRRRKMHVTAPRAYLKEINEALNYYTSHSVLGICGPWKVEEVRCDKSGPVHVRMEQDEHPDEKLVVDISDIPFTLVHP